MPQDTFGFQVCFLIPPSPDPATMCIRVNTGHGKHRHAARMYGFSALRLQPVKSRPERDILFTVFHVMPFACIAVKFPFFSKPCCACCRPLRRRLGLCEHAAGQCWGAASLQRIRTFRMRTNVIRTLILVAAHSDSELLNYIPVGSSGSCRHAAIAAPVSFSCFLCHGLITSIEYLKAQVEVINSFTCPVFGTSTRHFC